MKQVQFLWFECDCKKETHMYQQLQYIYRQLSYAEVIHLPIRFLVKC